MIGHISGKILDIGKDNIIVESGGIGYVVYVLSETLLSASKNSNISLWTYLAVRENALDLYGFDKKEELSFFKNLLSISTEISPANTKGKISINKTKQNIVFFIISFKIY